MSSFTHNSMASMLNLQGVIIYNFTSDHKTIKTKIGQPKKPNPYPYYHHNKLHNHGYDREKTIKYGIDPGEKMIILIWKSKRLNYQFFGL